ncbi:unnamed protein product [Trichogramma brassicae]|uniref:Uncharacterized protein n=1 Tax=Trichogramma brassicae TaxID=86971 RepID=A0A6H5ISK8_9HYME|nr:unnamed protein product [Trichogramma brassicae]
MASTRKNSSSRKNSSTRKKREYPKKLEYSKNRVLDSNSTSRVFSSTRTALKIYDFLILIFKCSFKKVCEKKCNGLARKFDQVRWIIEKIFNSAPREVLMQGHTSSTRGTRKRANRRCPPCSRVHPRILAPTSQGVQCDRRIPICASVCTISAPKATSSAKKPIQSIFYARAYASSDIAVFRKIPRFPKPRVRNKRLRIATCPHENKLGLQDLSTIFRPEEVDWLLVQDVFGKVDDDAGTIVDFAFATGYKDQPNAGEDGRPQLQRITALHGLMRSSRTANRRLVLKLFEIYHRFDANYVDASSGLTHFHVACRYGNVNAVYKFLNLGQDPNRLVKQTGDSPLHLALIDVDGSPIDALLRHGADPNLANAAGSTPLHVICSSPHRINHISAKVFFNFCDMFSQPVLVDARDKLGETPLHKVRQDFHETIKLLLRRGADPNLANTEGETFLHILCKMQKENDHADDLAEKFLSIVRELHRPVQIDVQDKTTSPHRTRSSNARFTSSSSSRCPSLILWRGKATRWTKRPDHHEDLRQARPDRRAQARRGRVSAPRRGVREDRQVAAGRAGPVAPRLSSAAAGESRAGVRAHGLRRVHARDRRSVPARVASGLHRPPVRRGDQKFLSSMGAQIVLGEESLAVGAVLPADHRPARDQASVGHLHGGRGPGHALARFRTDGSNCDSRVIGEVLRMRHLNEDKE